MDPLIQCKDLRYTYNSTEVLHGINFSVHKGEIVGLLGKNGAGKSTTINILMGFLQPDSGSCSVFGYPSHKLAPKERMRIGLLHEGFVQYNFMSIEEIERFYSAFYPHWNRKVYYDLIDLMGVPYSRRVTRLSCGQHSQVTLGLILAQQAELLILDDYSLGLDVGYRRLFLDYLRDFVAKNNTTVLLTSHIVAELENMLDTIIVLQRGNIIANESRPTFIEKFTRYDLPISDESLKIKNIQPLLHLEKTLNAISFYTNESEYEIQSFLNSVSPVLWGQVKKVPMTIEDVFVGLTGKY